MRKITLDNDKSYYIKYRPVFGDVLTFQTQNFLSFIRKLIQLISYKSTIVEIYLEVTDYDTTE